MMPRLTSILAALALVSLTGAAAVAAPEPAQRAPCFSSTNLHGWSAPGDGDVLLLRVNLNDIYRVDLTPGSRVSKSANRFLITRVRGSAWICSALDLEMTLADDNGLRQPLIARDLRQLTPAEVSAIPRKDLPA